MMCDNENKKRITFKRKKRQYKKTVRIILNQNFPTGSFQKMIVYYNCESPVLKNRPELLFSFVYKRLVTSFRCSSVRLCQSSLTKVVSQVKPTNEKWNQSNMEVMSSQTVLASILFGKNLVHNLISFIRVVQYLNLMN